MLLEGMHGFPFDQRRGECVHCELEARVTLEGISRLEPVLGSWAGLSVCNWSKLVTSPTVFIELTWNVDLEEKWSVL